MDLFLLLYIGEDFLVLLQNNYFFLYILYLLFLFYFIPLFPFKPL